MDGLLATITAVCFGGGFDELGKHCAVGWIGSVRPRMDVDYLKSYTPTKMFRYA